MKKEAQHKQKRAICINGWMRDERILLCARNEYSILSGNEKTTIEQLINSIWIESIHIFLFLFYFFSDRRRSLVTYIIVCLCKAHARIYIHEPIRSTIILQKNFDDAQLTNTFTSYPYGHAIYRLKITNIKLKKKKKTKNFTHTHTHIYVFWALNKEFTKNKKK